MRNVEREFPHGFQQNCLKLLQSVHKQNGFGKAIGRSIAMRGENFWMRDAFESLRAVRPLPRGDADKFSGYKRRAIIQFRPR
jgi:hypothetical protein